jgi:putative Mg2+ transporter-C (MgtC) family protein
MEFLQNIGIGTAQLKIALQVIIAMTLGAAVGYDREASDKPAGLRTHMLVAGAAALFVGLGAIIAQLYNTAITGSRIQTDPIRVFEAIITGISFLGAGTIIRHRENDKVEGITTAASLLMTAAIGATIGLSQWFLGVVLTLLVLIVLRFVGKVKANVHHTAHGDS